MDYLDYYSCMWNTLRVVEPVSGVSLTYDNSKLCERFPRWRDLDAFLRRELAIAVIAKH